MFVSRILNRTYVVTGGASGIGKATAELLRKDGHKVITVDLKGADINADLSTDDGVKQMVSEVTQKSGGVVDGVVANAGVSSNNALSIKINYYGAIGTLNGLKPLLEKSPAPRAVATASVASIQPFCEKLVKLMVEGSPAEAVALADQYEKDNTGVCYSSSKNALNRWMRRNASTPEWAGKGIALNCVAPAVIKTPMTEMFRASKEALDFVDSVCPMPLNYHAPPEAVGEALKFLVDEKNTHITGQVLFVDGGMDALLRDDKQW